MRDIIRKILKEEYNPEDYSWVDIGEPELIRDNAHRIELIEDVIKKVEEYRGWDINKDRFDGVVYWTGVDNYTGMATPEWNGPFEIPVDIMKGDDYDNVTVIKTPEFKYVIELQEWYKNKYFKLVYKCLEDYIDFGEVPGIIDASRNI